ncbi:DUF6233 domain-containing protein [Streptomyces diastatochromogenes]|uniref:DUF6233 domain-containing protein n=1 Tax=Streptomyces diastatochromogenes TaxID=42236 RepID=UPI003CC5329F
MARIDRKIELLVQRQAGADHGRRTRPRPPDWIVQLGIGVGQTPTQLRQGSCHMAGKRRRPIDRSEARHLPPTASPPAPTFPTARPCVLA